ncbi:MAG: hypothetical protein ACREEO_13830, partial [Phenylobacterium sp.]
LGVEVGAAPDLPVAGEAHHFDALVLRPVLDGPGGANLLSPADAGFEGAHSWGAANATIVTETSPALAAEGTSSLRVTATGAGPAQAAPRAYAAEPGQRWEAAAYARAASTTRGGFVNLLFYGSFGTHGHWGPSRSVVPASYTELATVAAVAPPGTTSVQMVVTFSDFGAVPAAGEAHRLDLARLYRPATERYTSYYAYDARGRRVAARDERSANEADNRYLTSYTYGPDETGGGLASVTTPATPDYPSGRTATYTYSTGTEAVPAGFGGGTMPRGLRLTAASPHQAAAGQPWRFAYDAKGDLRRATGPAGHVTEHTYDGTGRVVAQKEIPGTGPAGATTTWAYDGAGRPVTVTGPAVANPLSGVAHTARATHTYDANGNLATATVADLAPSGADAPRQTTYRYDMADRLVATVDGAGGTVESAYDAVGNLARTVDALGSVLEHAYTARGELATTTHRDYSGWSNLLAYHGTAAVARHLAGLEGPAAGWSAGANTTVAAVVPAAGTGWAGARALEVTAVSAGAARAQLSAPQRTAVGAGGTYSALAHARAATTGRPAQVGIQWH